MNDSQTLRLNKQHVNRLRAYRKRIKEREANPSSTSTAESEERFYEFTESILYRKHLNAERCRKNRIKCKRQKAVSNYNRTITTDTMTRYYGTAIDVAFVIYTAKYEYCNDRWQPQKWSQYVRNNKVELEKFSRRFIRAVARMLLHEKRNENEVWRGLRNETGVDCKELWTNMQALTVRKLQLLLYAEDCVDRLPRVARMTATDWLLFDSVLVHRNFDVIGVTENSKDDRQVLVDLFELVQKFNLESLAGDELAQAWSEATNEYNKENRKATPMLLQRRWYQLKLATRMRFYKYWSVYKGVLKRLNLADLCKPTKLQTMIAKKYKPLVVTTFIPWEQLVENKLIVLPEKFENLSKKEATVDNVPDVMCLEQDVETIDLDNDSDNDLEYRDVPQINNSTAVIIKQEPKEEDDVNFESVPVYENRQDKMANIAKAVMKESVIALEFLELIDNDDISIMLKREDTIITENSVEVNLVDGNSSSKNDSSTDVENTINSFEAEENHAMQIAYNPRIYDEVEIVPVTAYPNESPAQIDSNTNINDEINYETSDLMTGSDVEIVQDESEPMLPQITSIFGGFNDSNESLSKISIIANLLKKSVKDGVIQREIISNESPNNDVIECNAVSDEDEVSMNDENSDLTPKDNSSVSTTLQHTDSETATKTNSSWFGELSHDIDFADDGIQLMDDGIAYQENDGCLDQAGETKINLEIDEEVEKIEKAKAEMDQDCESNKFDEKLLIVPVVYTVKLEDMGILPLSLLNHVNNKEILEALSRKSKMTGEKIEANKDLLVDVKQVVKLKLSSYLLKKPRHRNYNPIQLCKNPDFNTRLKRLNVGFFSSFRNRLLLKACQPVTIDVSKDFEYRLVNGTIYLEKCDLVNSQENMDSIGNRANYSIMPSAMPVQSLIDNTEGQIATVMSQDINVGPVEINSHTPERNKVIHLPNISEIRRINENLLTAQVTPIQFKDDNIELQTIITPTCVNNSTNSSKAAPARRKRSIAESNNAILDVESQTSNGPRVKELSNKAIPWKSRELRPEVPWITSSSNLYSPDTLLALDTLYKMLNVLCTDDVTDVCKPSKKKRKRQKDDNEITSTNDETSCNKLPVLEHQAGETATDKDKSQDQESSVGIDTNADKVHNTLTETESISADVAELIPIRINPQCANRNKNKACNLDTNSVSTVSTVSVYDNSSHSKLDTDLEDLAISGAEISVVHCQDKPPTKVPVTINADIAASADDISNSCTQYEVDQCKQNEAGPSALGMEVCNISSFSSPVLTIDGTNRSAQRILTPSKKPSFRIKSAEGGNYNGLLGYRTAKVLNLKRRSKQTSLRMQNLTVTSENNQKTLHENYPIDMQNDANPVNNYEDLTPPLVPKRLNNIVKSELNHKMIYINSKDLAELPTDNPIFLDKNKILLTTHKFPKNFKAFEAYQQNLKNTMALPAGIKLILKPDGQLTYTRDVKAEISDEFLRVMPDLIKAIQQQLDNISSFPPVKAVSNDEIICLSDEETCDVENRDEKEGLSNRASVIQLNVAHHNSPDNSNAEKSMENSRLEIHTNYSKEKLVDNGIIGSECVSLDINELATEMQHKNKTMESNSNQKGKTKNILSDLMAMSGISQTEEAFLDVPCSEIADQTLIKNSKLSTHPTTDLAGVKSLQKCSNYMLLEPSKNSPPKASETADKSKLLPLTPITSLSELKYACLHKGTFFKLDLITRVLVPINVCMKNINDTKSPICDLIKYPTHNKPELITGGGTIDLTNDDIFDTSTTIQQNSLLRSKQTVSNSNKNSISNIEDDKIVKPLQLFSSRSYNLQHRLKTILKRVTDRKTAQDMIRRQERKGMFRMNPKSGQFESLETNICMEIQDSSSDEETLANIALKKRQLDNAKAPEKNDVSVYEENKVAGLPPENKDEAKTPCNVKGAEYLEEVLVDNELLQDNELDDACILGV